MPENDQHYLEKELYERMQSDSVLFEFLVSSSLDGLWYWDLESPEDKWVHPRIWEILGYDPQAMTHKASELEALLHPKDAALAKSNLEKHCEDPNLPYDQVLRYMHADGSTVWVRCFGIAVRNEDGKPIRMLGVHNEFTDIKEAEKQLRQTHKEYQALWEDAPVMHVQVDPKTAGIKKCNNNLVERLGYESMNDIIGRSVLSLYHEDCLPSARVAFQQFAKTGRVENAELILKTKEGDPVPVILNVAAVRDEDGKILHSCSTWVDISELKQAQESLRLSQERFKLFMDHSPMLAWIKDEELRLQYVNSSFEQHRGITSETGLGKKYSELLPGEISESVEATDRRVRDQLEVVEQVEDHLNARGETGKWLVFRFPIPGPDGTQWVAGTAMDITERFRLEAENRLTGFGLDRAAMPFFLVDSEARILRVNKAACRQSGYTLEEFAEMTVHDIDPDFPKEAWSKHWQELRKAGFLRFESHHRRKDGSIFPVEIESNFIEFEKEEYTLAFVRDITQRKEWSESQERQQAKLEEEVNKRTQELQEQRLAALDLAQENRLSGFGLEHAAIAFFLINEEGQVLRVNAAACEESGYAREELLQMTVFDLDPDFPKEQWPEHWQKLKANKFRRFEASHLHKDGKRVPKEIDSNFVEFEGRGYHFAFVRDISERRQWEKSKEHLQSELEKRVQELLKQRRSALQLADEADEARSRAESAERELAAVADELALPHGETVTAVPPIPIDQLTLSDEMAVGRQIRALCQQHETLEAYADGLLQFLCCHFRDEFGEPAFGLLQLHLTKSYSLLNPEQQAIIKKDFPNAAKSLPCLSLEASCLRPEWSSLETINEAAIGIRSDTFSEQYFPLASLLSQLNHNLLKVDSRDSHFHHEGVAAIHVVEAQGKYAPMLDSAKALDPPLKSLVGFGDYLLEDTHFLLTGYTCTPLSVESARFFVHLSHSVRIGILHFIKHHRRTFTQIQAVDSLLRGHEVFSSEQEERLLRTMSALTQSNDELRRSNDELDKFAFAVSHDLKSPLFAIQSLVNMIKEDMGVDLPHEVERNFDRLQRRVFHMEDLLDALLNYSRVGYVEDAPSQIHLQELLKAVMSLLDIPRDVIIELPDEMPTLIAPKGALLRVFTNLMSNSIKHGGRADLRIEIAWEDSGDFFTFTISDNGIGIPENHHDRVFEMFKSLEAKHMGGTSGMGLALVKKTIEHHGGTINLKSSPDEGARFTFTWPKSTLPKEYTI